MTHTTSAIEQVSIGEAEGVHDQHQSTIISQILQKLSQVTLPEQERVQRYMRHKWRLNHKSNSLRNSLKAIELFLTFYTSLGKSRLEEIAREDLEAFVESEQDRGTKITSARTRLMYLLGFLRFLIEDDVISETLLKRKIRLKLPDLLPRAMNPSDVRQLLSTIRHIRDRALILVLLRTGMRIGELLALKVSDLDIRERKIHLLEGEKNSLGRVVYLSDDALFALRQWLSKRDHKKGPLFYGRGHNPLGYSSARYLFVKYLKKAGLENRGYTVHSLRHTFASELLNAGMRLECLQQLLGHHNIEMTRRYARLTDKTREEEYFRAMAIIEKGASNGQG
ncbi:MAG TPA: tyrosine-type recombinase/integrase [Thermodesulfobacteriota bacterium]|jgi:integrase/recombinase XerD|nr:tyrosine-type recombinase/integrase [Thermodesulfobacteriota bacterium]